jgi:hypothetical protein
MASESPARFFGRALRSKDDKHVVQSLPRTFPSSNQDISLDDAGNYHRLDHPGVKGWPMQPQRLSKGSFQMFLNICIDFISLLVSIPFFLLAGSIASRDGKDLFDGDWKHLQYLIQLVRISRSSEFIVTKQPALSQPQPSHTHLGTSLDGQ